MFAAEEHVDVGATWGIYQRIVAASREPDKNMAKQRMPDVIDSASGSVPAALFQTSRTNVVEHITHVYEEGELAESATCRNLRQVRADPSDVEAAYLESVKQTQREIEGT